MKALFLLLLASLSTVAAPLPQYVGGFTGNAAGLTNVQPQQKFSIIQMSDVQYAIQCQSVFTKSIDYILAYAATNTVAAVVFPGDVVDDWTQTNQWWLWTNQVGRLRTAGLSVVSVAGNHDGTTTNWDKYVVPIMASDPKIAYHGYGFSGWDIGLWTNTINGVNLGIMWNTYMSSAALGPQLVILAKQYSKYKIISLIHSFLAADAQLSTPANDAFFIYGGAEWWNYYKTIPNLVQVWSGHTAGDANHNGLCFGWLMNTFVGDAGNEVVASTFDTQMMGDPFVGVGGICGVQYIRIHQWDPSANSIKSYVFDTDQLTDNMLLVTSPVVTNASVAVFPITASPVVPAPPIQASPADTGLIFHCPLDEQSGGVIHDTGPFGLTSDLVGSVLTWFGPTNSAVGKGSLRFTSTLGVSCNFSNVLPFSTITSNFTVGCWFKNVATPTSTEIMVARHNAGTVGEWYLGQNLNGGTISSIAVCGGVRATLSANPVITTNVWHHAAETYDGTNVILYFDGQAVYSVAASGAVLPQTMPTVLGTSAGSVGTTNYSFNGLLDDVRVYNRTLSAQQIAELARYSPPLDTIVANYVVSSNVTYYPLTIYAYNDSRPWGDAPIYYFDTIGINTDGSSIIGVPVPGWVTKVVSTVTAQWSGTSFYWTNRFVPFWYTSTTRGNSAVAFMPQMFTNGLNYISGTVTWPGIGNNQYLAMDNSGIGAATNTSNRLKVMRWDLTLIGNPNVNTR